MPLYTQRALGCTILTSASALDIAEWVRANPGEQPRAWRIDAPNLSVVSEWHYPLGDAGWPMWLAAASDAPRALLVRGRSPRDARGWAATSLAAYDLRGSGHEIAALTSGAEPWAVWLTSPTFWPQWVISQVHHAPRARDRIRGSSGL